LGESKEIVGVQLILELDVRLGRRDSMSVRVDYIRRKNGAEGEGQKEKVEGRHLVMVIESGTEREV
jgi:hypothetical protein